jgi:ornithine cyclodeaminase
MLVLARAHVEALLDMDTLIDALAPARADLSAGRASAPDRVAALVPEHEGFLEWWGAKRGAILHQHQATLSSL